MLHGRWISVVKADCGKRCVLVRLIPPWAFCSSMIKVLMCGFYRVSFQRWKVRNSDEIQYRGMDYLRT